MKSSLTKFQLVFHLPKMVAILNFRIFFKNAKHKNACILKTVPDRVNLADFFTHMVSVKTSLSKFQRIFQFKMFQLIEVLLHVQVNFA